MHLLRTFWADERGFVLTAEAALLATVGIVGATVGIKMAAESVNEELQEVSSSFRSLDQSYCYNGFASCRAWTAGSKYQQPSVKGSQRDLRKPNDRKPPRKTDRRKPSHSRRAKSRKPKRGERDNRKDRNSLRKRGDVI